MYTMLPLVCAATMMACADRVNRERFSGVSRAAHALKLHLAETGCGGATTRCGELVQAFQLEAAALNTQTVNAREEEALSSYKQSVEAYAFFARLRFLEADAVALSGNGETLLLIGTNEVSAKRFKVPLENRGSGTWADTAGALTITLTFAEQQLAEAERIVKEG
jgi:hypothetical protein